MRMRFFGGGGDSQLLNSQLAYYIRGDESRRAQNAIIEFVISLKTQKRNLFTTHLNVGLRHATGFTINIGSGPVNTASLVVAAIKI